MHDPQGAEAPTPPSPELERQRGYSAGWHAGFREGKAAATAGVPDEPGDDDFPTTAAVLDSLEDIEQFHDDADMQTAAGVARLALIGYRDRYAELLAEVERLRAAAPAETIHACPPGDAGLTPCCVVTCGRAAAPASEDDACPSLDDLKVVVRRYLHAEHVGNEAGAAAFRAKLIDWTRGSVLRAPAGSPPPTPAPAPTRELVDRALDGVISSAHPRIRRNVVDAVMALLSAEPAPPLWTGETTPRPAPTIIPPVESRIDVLIPVPPGTAVEVREKRP